VNSRVRLSAVAIGSTSALLIMAASGAASASPSAGIKGSPQPELKPFHIGASDTAGGGVAIEPNGTLVVVYDISGGAAGQTRVCVLARGKSACSHTATLSPLSGDTLSDTPQVFIPSSNHVVVLQEACCDANPSGGDVLYSSSDGGKTFGAPVRVGSLDVDAATLVGSQIVSASYGHDGAQVESIPTDATGPSAVATLTGDAAEDIGVGQYRHGVLVANESLGGTTSVEYAPAADNASFGVASSYTNVGNFRNEDLLAISGDALLTIQTTGKNLFQLRFFNGTSFSAAHAVPGLKDHLIGEWSTIDQDRAGVTHVFIESSFASPIYTLEEVSTTNGSHWSGRTDLGNAIDSDYFNAGLDSSGSGLVLGNGDSKAIGYPVLATQSVSFALTKSSIKKGHTTTGKGKAAKAAAGRKIELQIEKAGRWYNVATRHESGSGSFTFTIKGSSVGVAKYRAVASDLAGYVQYGYSPARTLSVTT
jgi:hypothetical protein